MTFCNKRRHRIMNTGLDRCSANTTSTNSNPYPISKVIVCYGCDCPGVSDVPHHNLTIFCNESLPEHLTVGDHVFHMPIGLVDTNMNASFECKHFSINHFNKLLNFVKAKSNP